MFVVLAAGLLSVALFFLGRYTASPGSIVSVAAPLKSIAVLPFENRSEDKANAYFADGIQDEILTRLAKIDDLKVISRTSTQRYKSSPDNLRDIAKQLGVGHVLEGSVQRSGDQVRVNVQLINAETDAHLWAEVYDRKVADIFAVQSEIAETIAKALRVKLSSREKEAVARRSRPKIPRRMTLTFAAWPSGTAWISHQKRGGRWRIFIRVPCSWIRRSPSPGRTCRSFKP